MIRYLVEWDGYTEGPRDGGYPERKYHLFDSLDKIVELDFLKNKENVQISHIYPYLAWENDIDYVERKIEKDYQIVKRRQKEAEFEKLRKELGK